MTRKKAKPLCDYVRAVLSDAGLTKPVNCKCDLCNITNEVLALLDSIESKDHVSESA